MTSARSRTISASCGSRRKSTCRLRTLLSFDKVSGRCCVQGERSWGISVASTDSSFVEVLCGIPLTPGEVRYGYDLAYRYQLTVYVPSVDLIQKVLEMCRIDSRRVYTAIIKHALQSIGIRWESPIILGQVKESQFCACCPNRPYSS